MSSSIAIETDQPAEGPTYRLTDVQHRVFMSPARHRVWIAGRRSGKSRLGVVECIAAAGDRPGRLVWYIAPTLDDARDLAWEPLKAMLPPWAIAMHHETRLTIMLTNGSRIALKSADRPDRLRGRGVDLAVLDEFRWIDQSVRDVLRPALSDRKGRTLYLTSPSGFGWSYDLYLKGQGGSPHWQSWSSTTLDGGFVSAEEIAEAQAEMDPRMFRQEYLASFETLEGRVYSNFLRTANVQPGQDTGAELLVGMDFNVHPMSYVVGVKQGDGCHILEAHELPVSNTEEVVEHIRQRFPGRRVIVCPDPSGRARKTSAPVGQTDFTILQRAGFIVDAPNAAPPVVDRVNNVQAMLLSANGRRRLTVSPTHCLSLIKALDGLTYREGTNLPDKTSGLDHVTDALGYLCWQRFNLLQDRTVRLTTVRV